MKIHVHRSKLINQLLKQEDTTKSNTITIEDKGKKEFTVKDIKGNVIHIVGTYHLGNLLQETALLKEKEGFISLNKIDEKPTKRISRLIKDYYWKKLTRSTNKEDLFKVLEDEKRASDVFRIYVPEQDLVAKEFYQKIAKKYNHVKIELLPKKITKEDIENHLAKPGILSLKIDSKTKKSVPYVVPGGRFNEMYGWDSYFIALGLMIDDKFKLTKGIIDNLEYQILHYGKILNANRNYYLSRSQPPFFTSLIKQFYEKYSDKLSLDWLENKLNTAIKEYQEVWMTENIRLSENGLNRYFGEGKKIPIETEKGHFNFVLKKYAKKHHLTVEDFEEKYKKNILKEPELDEYFVNDRSMRESGHDTTTRLDGVASYINPVSLNSLLYKFETDFAYLIKTYFKDSFLYNNTKISSAFWLQKSEKRKEKIQNLLWNVEDKTFYDYNFKSKKPHKYVSVTNFYPLWAKIATKEQAESLVNIYLPKLLCRGGVASTGVLHNDIESDTPSRQWDYPYGWAPHQMLLWQGLINYNYNAEAQELIYRWLWIIVKTAVDYNGLIPEKFDVLKCTHKITVEYGNVGDTFKYIPNGGFGWTNASFKLGLKLLEKRYLADLNLVINPDALFLKTQLT
jgi:alpha,alpha-trehalase